MLELFLTYLQAHGWTLQRSPTPGFPEPLARRYPRCPEDWLVLLASVRSLVREDGGAWFLCGPDYAAKRTAHSAGTNGSFSAWRPPGTTRPGGRKSGPSGTPTSPSFSPWRRATPTTPSPWRTAP